jgi:peptidoglycan/LPS O-acetylase OafA/YrhL
MTVLAIGTCMMIGVAAQTNWKSPRFLNPLLNLGQRSYEVYLTHMFVVFGAFQLFVLAGKPIIAVPALFLVVILSATLLGGIVAQFFSEPLNKQIRDRCGHAVERAGPV